MNPTATSSGFISAGGKGVSISAKALLEVKDMFKNSDGIVDSATTCGPREGHTNEKSFELKSNFRTVNCGFTSAGGKRVSVSEKALLRANALLKECDEKPHVESESLEFMAGSTPDPRHKNGCGLSTASGKGVSVSLRALREAKARFADCDDAASPEPGEVKAETLGENSTSAHKKDSTNSNCGFSTASGPLSQGQAADRQSARENGKAPVRPGGPAPSRERSAPGRAAVETADCEARRSSSPNLRSPGLSSCADTQQRYLEQEAMACTRALLEDEDLAEQGLREAPGGRLCSLVLQHGVQPRLLADFDQTSDSDQRPVLTPVKSSPNVMLRDRRIFRYGVPLQPNVTHPPGDKKGVLDHRHRKTEPQVVVPGSFLQDSKPVNPRDPGSEEKMSGQESGTHTPHSACGGAHSGQGPVTPNTPAGREAEPEEPAPAPPSPGDQEASSSDVQTLQNLQLARDLQDMRIRKKRRQAVRPQPGCLLLAKTSGVARVPLRSAVGGRCPGLHTPKELYACGVPRGTSQIGSGSAESFRFRCGDFFREEVLAAGGGVPLADGGPARPRQRRHGGEGGVLQGPVRHPRG
ncbi:hypothetical protein ANANG_G00240150 [Anguilla anguilla]|uniref:Breast cancer type 2 susceptibility protein helical domain-containing protein n=1 Tax=Anguilla anguilla TaxID=7936 RepID=A0A9D3LXC3_ANGAN|nr:hypothetical protein ANANG_G00240150 [Anguilla anguilla]